jgi:hypothetical protein
MGVSPTFFFFGLKLPGAATLPISASCITWMTDMCHHAQLWLKLLFSCHSWPWTDILPIQPSS